MEVWTQSDELRHIRRLGIFSERSKRLRSVFPNDAEYQRESLFWRIHCLEGYLEGSASPRATEKRFPGYNLGELVRVAELELAEVRAALKGACL